MKIKMKLLSDAVFGNGASVPGAEDISVLHDTEGFPYYKGGTFKGIFREALALYLSWVETDENKVKQTLENLLGSETDQEKYSGKIYFSDFTLSDAVKNRVLAEIGQKPDFVLDAFTNQRMFTAMNSDDSGTVKAESLRMVRCVNKGIYYYSEVICSSQQEELIREILPMIKWIGSMRNRGFGKVSISVE